MERDLGLVPIVYRLGNGIYVLRRVYGIQHSEWVEAAGSRMLKIG